MTSLSDAYALLDLDEDACVGEVALRYACIVSEDSRPGGRRRTNMPAIDHAFKCILNSMRLHGDSRLLLDEPDYDDDEEFYDDQYMYDSSYYDLRDSYGDYSELREAKFSRNKTRTDSGYRANTDSAAVAASAEKLLLEEAAKQQVHKADKKKKKHKKKKKKNTENTPPANINNNNDMHNENETDSDTDGEGLDLNSAFAKAARKDCNKMKPLPLNGNRVEPRRPAAKPTITQSAGGGGGAAVPADTVLDAARRMAAGGNELAKQGQFGPAVRVFTNAIRLDPHDHRFFGNRSFCFERLRLYDKALRDAERAIEIDSAWPKGYFRKGRALLGQMKYDEAETAFRAVLRLDKNVVECWHELRRIVVFRLMKLGVQKERARSAARQFRTLDAALDALDRGDVRDMPDASSDSEDDTGEPSPRGALNPKEDPSNLEGLSSLWVGNVMPTATEREIAALFAKHGAVTSVRLLSDRFCAFVNFSEQRGASLAMQHLQGAEFHGKLLKIKFPDNPLDRGAPQGVVIGRKTTVPAATAAAAAAATAARQRPAGPVGDGECYFWRARECVYGANCRYKHVPAHKGVDRRPAAAVRH